MEVSQKNVVDLRKISRKSAVQAPLSPQTPSPSSTNRIRPILFLIIGMIGVGLIAYFATSGNYLASFFFLLAGIVGAIGIFSVKRP